jgi:hypothetical protein
MFMKVSRTTPTTMSRPDEEIGISRGLAGGLHAGLEQQAENERHAGGDPGKTAPGSVIRRCTVLRYFCVGGPVHAGDSRADTLQVLP